MERPIRTRLAAWRRTSRREPPPAGTLAAPPGFANVRFLGDDMVHTPRRWDTSPPFSGLADELPPGAAMDHPLFPVLWP